MKGTGRVPRSVHWSVISSAKNCPRKNCLAVICNLSQNRSAINIRLKKKVFGNLFEVRLQSHNKTIPFVFVLRMCRSKFDMASPNMAIEGMAVKVYLINI